MINKEIKLLDSSYFSNMLGYYPLDNKNFNFIWNSLIKKIKNKEIIILDVVYEELKAIEHIDITKILKIFKENLMKTNPVNYKKIFELYNKNKENFSKSNKNSKYFKNIFGTGKKKINADPYLIAKAIEIPNSIILTDELPSAKNPKSKLKLNIPNFASLFKIKCCKLIYNLDKIIN